MKFALKPGTKLLDFSLREVELMKLSFYSFRGEYRTIAGTVYAVLSRHDWAYNVDPALLPA